MRLFFQFHQFLLPGWDIELKEVAVKVIMIMMAEKMEEIMVEEEIMEVVAEEIMEVVAEEIVEVVEEIVEVVEVVEVTKEILETLELATPWTSLPLLQNIDQFFHRYV